MRQVVRRICSLLFVVIVCIPCFVYSYNFDNDIAEQRAKITRREIYDLYNMHKEMMNESEDEDDDQFGVLGYNGVCSTVTVDGKSIPLDEYIAGVIKQEMGGSQIEALKAQAIAARSFVISKKQNDSSCTVGNGQFFQAYTTAYDGEIYMKAAKETSGMVVSRNGKVATTAYQSHPAGMWQKEDSSGWHVTFQRFSDDPSTKWTWNGPSKDTVRRTAGGGSLYGTEMNYDNPHNWGMSQTIAMYLAAGENYKYTQIIDLFYKEPIVTLSDGKYDGNISYVNAQFGKVYYYNQGDYAAYQYHPACGSIQACGCGPTSVAIIASSMLKRQISPVETTNKLCAMGGCSAGGSYAGSLTQELKTVYGLNARNSNSDQEAITALGTGKALIIVNMGPGMFTTGGHYMVLAGVNKNREVLVVDPGSRQKTNQWYSFNIIMEQRRKHDASYIIVTK